MFLICILYVISLENKSYFKKKNEKEGAIGVLIVENKVMTKRGLTVEKKMTKRGVGVLIVEKKMTKRGVLVF